MKIYLKSIAVGIITVFMMAGCIGQKESDESKITKEINQSEYLADNENEDEAGVDEVLANSYIGMAEYTYTTANAISFAERKWMREGWHKATPAPVISINGDTAYVTLTHNITGKIKTFLIDTTTQTAIFTDFAETRTRKIEYKKNGEEWVLSRLTPVNIVSQNTNNIEINKVTLYRSQSGAKGDIIAEYTNPVYENFKSIDSAVKLSKNEQIIVEVEMKPQSPADAYVFVHFGKKNEDQNMKRYRKMMANNGNGVYSYTLNVENIITKWNSIKIDAIDKETIINYPSESVELYEYHSNAWRIPYRVEK